MPQNPFYSSKVWRDLRASTLHKSPHCVVCLNIGLKIRATEVDHILAIDAGGAPLNPANVRSLCRKHHSQKTIMLDGQHSADGRKLVTTGLDGYPVQVEVKGAIYNGNQKTRNTPTAR